MILNVQTLHLLGEMGKKWVMSFFGNVTHTVPSFGKNLHSTVAPAFNLKSISPPVIPRISYTVVKMVIRLSCTKLPFWFSQNWFLLKLLEWLLNWYIIYYLLYYIFLVGIETKYLRRICHKLLFNNHWNNKL